jgi:hypothetical protein
MVRTNLIFFSLAQLADAKLCLSAAIDDALLLRLESVINLNSFAFSTSVLRLDVQQVTDELGMHSLQISGATESPKCESNRSFGLRLQS